MRIEQLEQLIQIKQWGSLNIAAHYLNMTQQNLSRSVMQLENELNVSILTRHNKGVAFTKKGEEVLNFAIKVLSEYKKMLLRLTTDETNILEQKPTSHLNVVLTTGLDFIFNAIYYNIVMRNFIVTANVHEADLSHVIDMLLTDSFYDILILQQTSKFLNAHSIPASNYHLFVLYTEKIELVTSKSSPYAELPSISKKQLEKIPLVTVSEKDTPSNIVKICLDNGISLNIATRTNIISTIQEQIIYGSFSALGCPSVQSSIKANPLTREAVVTIPIDIPLQICTALFIKKDLFNSNLGETVLNIVQQAYNQSIEQLY